MRAARNAKRMKVVEPTEAEIGISRDVASQPKEGEEIARGRLSAKRRGFARVPTHVVGVAHDRRAYSRAALSLPLRLKRVGDRREPVPISLVTKNISSSGVYFLCPRWIEPGTPVELEVGLVERPMGRGSVRMSTAAHVVRIEPTQTPGWHGLAVTFDDITFHRDEPIPPRFQKV